MSTSENEVGLYLSIIHRAALSYFTKALKPFHIGPGTQAYILAIGDDEVLSQEELSKRLRVDKANVTRAMKLLESRAIIHREVDETDQRRVLISLTPRGRDIKNEITLISKKWIEMLKTPLEESEWSNFNNSLTKIIENIDKKK